MRSGREPERILFRHLAGGLNDNLAASVSGFQVGRVFIGRAFSLSAPFFHVHRAEIRIGAIHFKGRKAAPTRNVRCLWGRLARSIFMERSGDGLVL